MSPDERVTSFTSAQVRALLRTTTTDLFNRNAHVINNQISGVFDWGNSMIGDPLYDVALLSFWQPWFESISDQPVLDELNRRLGREPQMDDEHARRMRACLVHIALEHIGYNAWLDDFAEVQAVIDRMDIVATQAW